MKDKYLLVVEDEEDTIVIFKIALEEAGFDHEVLFARTGEEAIQLLFGDNEEACSRIPELVILDINLPGLSGFDVLRAIRSHPECSKLSVLICSSSGDSKDIDSAYQLQANGYVVKPSAIYDW